MTKRPIPVIVIACLFLAVGVIASASDLIGLGTEKTFSSDRLYALAVHLLAVICGVYLLRGKDWARWLALLWMAFHVILSWFHPLRELILHALLLGALAYFLLRAQANEYFRRRTAES